jgi:prepilin signal peptidase PulO-like enzyme (type II secretory pathway)
MELILLSSIFVVGLCLGSFLSVLISRLDRKEGIAGGRSECPDCRHQIMWYVLFPVFSYIWLGGKCRYCHSKISILYPLLEIIMAASLIAYFGVNGIVFNVHSIYYSTLLVLFASLIFFDLLYLILPDKITFTIGGLAISYSLFFRLGELPYLLAFGFLLALAFAIIYSATHGKGMGFGDVKLAFVMGLVLGYPLGFFATIVAVWSAALVGVVLMLLKKASMKTALPFGSFLALSTLLFIIFGKIINEKISFYINPF